VRKLAFDANVLLYAELEPDSNKGDRAAQLIAAGASRGVLAAQALGEFLNVVRRRAPVAFEEAQRQAEAYRAVFTVVPTGAGIILEAAAFARRYRLQFWDAVIWRASVAGGAAILLSEDLQDGFAAEGMQVVNPFADEWNVLTGRLRL
jgi:predicted nucleic acid-binding protein